MSLRDRSRVTAQVPICYFLVCETMRSLTSMNPSPIDKQRAKTNKKNNPPKLLLVSCLITTGKVTHTLGKEEAAIGICWQSSASIS